MKYIVLMVGLLCTAVTIDLSCASIINCLFKSRLQSIKWYLSKKGIQMGSIFDGTEQVKSSDGYTLKAMHENSDDLQLECLCSASTAPDGSCSITVSGTPCAISLCTRRLIDGTCLLFLGLLTAYTLRTPVFWRRLVSWGLMASGAYVLKRSADKYENLCLFKIRVMNDLPACVETADAGTCVAYRKARIR